VECESLGLRDDGDESGSVVATWMLSSFALPPLPRAVLPSCWEIRIPNGTQNHASCSEHGIFRRAGSDFTGMLPVAIPSIPPRPAVYDASHDNSLSVLHQQTRRSKTMDAVMS
jgi:hypothetical protein